MNHKRLISLTICFILSVVPGLSVLSFAGNESETNTKAEQHYEKANELRKLADYDTAITEYEKVMSLSPKSEIAQNAQYWIGQSNFEAGKFDVALSAFQKLLDEYPDSTVIPSTKIMIERIQQAKKNKSLFEAARKGDIEQIELLILEGADVNTSMTSADGPWTPLLDATCTGQTQVVKLLLQHGAKVDAGDKYGYTPLFYAIWSKHEEGLKALISAGADINKRPSEKDCPPLFYAVWEDYKSGIRILIDAGANVNAEDEKGWTPFRYAALEGIRDMVELFVAKGADVSSFHLAALIGDLARVKRLIDQGIDVDTKDKFGWAPLYWAACTGQRDVAEFLVAKGADVNAKTDSNRTALHQAGRSGARELAELLISNGADVNATTNNADTPLHLAAETGHRDVVELLIVKGADINVKDKTGGTPLHNATKVGHKEVGEILIAGGADVNAKDGQGRTPLHWAARTTPPGYLSVLQGRRDTAKLLIANGADLNAKNKLGRTPLHTAVRNGRKEVGEILIAKVADINARDNEGRTPLWWAKYRGRNEIVELLRKHGAKE